jgi:hypothetical protein
LKIPEELSAWLSIVRDLRGKATGCIAPNRLNAIDPRDHLSGTYSETSATHNPRVLANVLERPTTTTAIVDWCDPGSCRYRDQMWRVTRARNAGVCALSDFVIVAGERVYQPRTCQPTPKNARAMIRAEQIEQGYLTPSASGATNY